MAIEINIRTSLDVDILMSPVGLTRESAELVVACVEACEGINPKAVPFLHEACEFAGSVSQVDDRTKRIGETAIAALDMARKRS